MDEDPFGSSVWGTPAESPTISSPQRQLHTTFPSSPLTTTLNTDDQFDDFDDFGTSQPTETDRGADDDFGDFGDFGEVGEIDDHEGFGERDDFSGKLKVKDDWKPLKVEPQSTREQLQSQIHQLLEPIWPLEELTSRLTEEGLRQVEGVKQILTTAESRELYKELKGIPPIKPMNWTRSRIRRQQLIALGVPVNLDEVMPHASGKPLPPLQITTRPSSAPPVPRPGVTNSKSNTPATASNSRAGTPGPGTPQSVHPTNSSTIQRLGPMPTLDEVKVLGLLDVDSSTLPLMPVAKLERYLADIREQTMESSALLTHLLQTREALQQDSETYNSLIAELVGEAQKRNNAKNRSSGKRGSGIA